MIWNRYVFSLIFSVLISVLSFFLVITRLDPFVDEQIAVSLFFVSLFLMTSSVTSLLGYLIRVIFYRSELFLNHFNVSLRQGILIGLGITGLFGLQVLQTLGWWNGLMVIALCVFTELYFVAKE